jgi:hypothetical protein
VFGLVLGALLVLSLIVAAVLGNTGLGTLAEQLQTPKRPRPGELRFVRAPRIGRWTRADWARVILAAALGLGAAWATLVAQRACRERAAARATAPDYLRP